MKNIVKFAQRKDTAFLCGLFRYDYGQQLIIEGLNLPDDFKVHFQTEGGIALVMKGCKNGDEYSVSIPDEILQQAVDETKAWIYLEDKTSGKTIKTIVMHLNDREKPSDIPPQEDVATVKGYAEYVKENAEKISQAQAAGDRAKEIADELIRAKENGEFNGKDAEPITIDTELSETSSNAIANSAVAKVLSGGRLVGIETIYDYEDLMDFESKYWDIENDAPNYADDEFFILFVIDDIYDESGEYGDNECLLKKGLYFESNNEGLTVGEVSIDDFNAIVRRIESLEDSLKSSAAKAMTAKLIDGFEKVYVSSFSAGIKQIVEEVGLYNEKNNELLMPLKSGDIVFKSFKALESRLLVLSSYEGKIYSVDGLSDTPVSYYLNEAETEKLVDDKLAEQKGSLRLLADTTITYDNLKVYHPISIDCENGTMQVESTEGLPTTAVPAYTINQAIRLFPDKKISGDSIPPELFCKLVGFYAIDDTTIGFKNTVGDISSFTAGEYDVNKFQLEYGGNSASRRLFELIDVEDYAHLRIIAKVSASSGIAIRLYNNNNVEYAEISDKEDAIYPLNTAQGVHYETLSSRSFTLSGGKQFVYGMPNKIELDILREDGMITVNYKWLFYAKKSASSTKINCHVDESTIILQDSGIKRIRISYFNSYGTLLNGSNVKVYEVID